jgi:hypothetical protein
MLDLVDPTGPDGALYARMGMQGGMYPSERGGMGVIEVGGCAGKYRLHATGVTARGVPLIELTQPAAVSLLAFTRMYGLP